MEDFAPWQIVIIGIVETLGVLGLTLPHVIKILPRRLIPLSSAGLGFIMIGAIVTHIQRQDPTMTIVITAFLLVLCIIIRTTGLHKRQVFNCDGEL